MARNAQKKFLIGQSSRSYATYRRPSLDVVIALVVRCCQQYHHHAYATDVANRRLAEILLVSFLVDLLYNTVYSKYKSNKQMELALILPSLFNLKNMQYR